MRTSRRWLLFAAGCCAGAGLWAAVAMWAAVTRIL